MELEWDRAPVVAVGIVVFLVLMLFRVQAASFLAAASYRVAGYSWDVSMNAARIRDVGWSTPVSIFWPGLFAVALTPVISMLPRTSSRWALFAAVHLSTAIATIAWWWLPCLIA